jgi:hypothetical protein
MELKSIPVRMVLYPRDIVLITGKSLRACQRLVVKIRLAYGKSGSGFVTVREFCSYCGFLEEEVMKYLRD